LSCEEILALAQGADAFEIFLSIRHGRTVYSYARENLSDTGAESRIRSKSVNHEPQRQSIVGNARLTAVVIAVVTWFALALQLYLIVGVTVADGGSALIAVVNYLSFFTILTNLLVALTLTFALWGGSSKAGVFFRSPGVQSAMAAYIAIVGILYSLLLRHVWNPQGLQKLADLLLHDAVPLLFVLFWFLFVPKQALRWGDPVRWLIYPLAYLVYVLLRGVLLTHYPYYFIDVRALGLPIVLLNAAMLVAAFLVVGMAMVAIGHWAERPRNA
jgi:hypothetical protein